MALAIGMVTTDCADPKALATFWAAALGTSVSGDYGEFVMLAPPPAGGPVLGFQRVPEERSGKNRLHLDVRVGAGLTGDERVSALEAEAARLEPLGARRLHLLPADEENEACLVMQDVEGNEFCLD